MANGISIGCGKNEQFDNLSKKCICKPNFLFVSGNCVACPDFSILNLDKTKFLCNDGYIWNDWEVACVPFKCPLNSFPIVSEFGVKCNCKEGYFMNADFCEFIPKCPFGATFDSVLRTCVCEKSNSYLIKGQCSECPLNSAWNGK